MTNSNLPPWKAKMAAVDDAQRIFSGKRWGQDAVKIAETAADYVRDMDNRLKRAAIAHTIALHRTPPPPAPTEPPPPGLPYSEQWLDPVILKRAMGTSAGSHAKAVAEAVSAHAQDASQMAADVAANATFNAWKDYVDQQMAPSVAFAPAGAPAQP